MKLTHIKRLALGILLACAGLTVHGQGIVVREDDGSPRKQGATEIIFDNGTVTNQSGGKVRVTNGGGGASAAADVTVAATPSNYTAATQDVEDHLAGVDGALGSVETTANGAAADAATAITDAAAALVRTNHTGLQASTTVTQSQTTWTDTPTIAVAADVNGKLIKGSAATAKTATLIAGIAADVAAFPFANIGTSSWQFIGDGTSVLKDGKNTTVWTGGAGVGVTVFPGNTALIVPEGSNTWRVYASGFEEVYEYAFSDETTAITTGTAKITFRMPYAFQLTEVRASLSTTSSSGVPTFDLNEGGTTVISTKLTIDATELTSTTAAAAAVISDATLADDALMTVDIDVAGTGAKGGKIKLYGRRLE